MSATVIEDKHSKTPRLLFRKVSETFQGQKPSHAETETFKKVQEDLEKRLGTRKTASSLFDLFEIQQVAEIVDEVLEKRNYLKMSSTAQESHRVAPAPDGPRHQAYEQQQPLPASLPPNHQQQRRSLPRSATTGTLQGIYTIPSTDADPEKMAPLPLTPVQSSSYLTGKLVSNALLVIQVALIIIYALFIYYDDTTVSPTPKTYSNVQKPTQRPLYDKNFYSNNPSYNNGPPPPPPEQPPEYNPPDQEERYIPYSQQQEQQQQQQVPEQQQHLVIQQPTQNLHQYYYCE